MIYAYNNTSQTIATGGAVVFNTVGIRTGNTSTLPVGSGAISLNKPGYYLVHFNADVATADAAGDVTIGLSSNGAAVAGAQGTENSTATTNIGNIAFQAIIRVLPNCCANMANNPVTLTFVNRGVGAIISNTAVTVTRIA